MCATWAARNPTARVGLVLAATGCAACVVMWVVVLTSFHLGEDLAVYRSVTDRWLSGQSPYTPQQLAGPYLAIQGTSLYPPVTLVAMTPLLRLPTPLWWAIPLLATFIMVVRQRPSLLAVGAILWSLAVPASVRLIASGNPGMWTLAAFAIAIEWRPASALVLLKPSLFPLALIGVPSRGWWVVVCGIALASLALWPETTAWLRAVVNARGDHAGLLYSLGDVGLYLVPLLAYVGRSPSRRGDSMVAGGFG